MAVVCDLCRQDGSVAVSNCVSCSLKLCSACLLGHVLDSPSKGHELARIEDPAAVLVDKTTKKLLLAIDQIKQRKKLLNEDVEISIDNISRTFDELQSLLSSQKESVMAAVRQNEAALVDKLETHLKSLETVRSSVASPTLTSSREALEISQADSAPQFQLNEFSLDPESVNAVKKAIQNLGCVDQADLISISSSSLDEVSKSPLAGAPFKLTVQICGRDGKPLRLKDEKRVKWSVHLSGPASVELSRLPGVCDGKICFSATPKVAGQYVLYVQGRLDTDSELVHVRGSPSNATVRPGDVCYATAHVAVELPQAVSRNLTTARISIAYKDALGNAVTSPQAIPSAYLVPSCPLPCGVVPGSCHDPTVHAAVSKISGQHLYTMSFRPKVLGEHELFVSFPNEEPRSVGKVRVDRDLTWMDTSDEFGGFRHSSHDPDLAFAVAKSNIWEVDRWYDAPDGYRWATTQDIQERCPGGDNGVFVYFKQGGWDEFTWNGRTRVRFRFSDSWKTGGYKHAGNSEVSAPLYDLSIEAFAGIVCIGESN